jgi:AcrR family transcriptional regulator
MPRTRSFRTAPADAARADPAAPGGGRRERNKREKLERIRAAARRLFASRGFERTTTREIADAAGIAAGTLFLYAPSKEDLLVLIFQDEVGRVIDEAFATVPGRPLLDQVLHVFGAITAYVATDRSLARTFVKEVPFASDGRHGVAHVMSEMNVRLAGLIASAKGRGEIAKDVPERLLALNLFAVYFQSLQLWLAGRAPALARRDARLRAALDLQLRGARRPAR